MRACLGALKHVPLAAVLPIAAPVITLALGLGVALPVALSNPISHEKDQSRISKGDLQEVAKTETAPAELAWIKLASIDPDMRLIRSFPSEPNKPEPKPAIVVQPMPVGKAVNGFVTIRASCGKKASARVAADVAPAFQGLVNDLCAASYPISFMGGLRSEQSGCAPPRHKHPCGWALDINQTSRNVVTKQFPANVNKMARRWGLLHGDRENWHNNPDRGHFEVISKAVTLAAIARNTKHANDDFSDRTLGAIVKQSRGIDSVQASLHPVAAPSNVDDADASGRCLDYLVRTATIGYTMQLQGPRTAIGTLHPEFRKRLCSGIVELRERGFGNAGIFSAFRPPKLRVGGFRNKFRSEHSVGLAADLAGVGSSSSRENIKAHAILAKHKVYGVYGPYRRGEHNHFQVVLQKAVPERSELRKSITAEDPVSREKMWAAADKLIVAADSGTFRVAIEPRKARHARRHIRRRAA